VFKTVSLMPYLLGGLVMWWCMFMSGIHATIAGVVLAFVIPFKQAEHSLGSTLESKLHYPVALVILPVFALANTGISLDQDWIAQLLSMNSLGIISGLLIGKPIGILLFSYIAVKLGLCRLPRNITWSHIGGAGILGGIGFTMSIFISNLAFPNETTMVTASKMAILTASITAGCLGILWLNLVKTSREMHRRS
jgi:NhaA family Na+:H+ antiporter